MHFCPFFACINRRIRGSLPSRCWFLVCPELYLAEKRMKRTVLPLTVLALAATFPTSTSAAVIIGNMPLTGTASTLTIDSTTGAQSAFKFTPSQTYDVTGVQLALISYRTSGGSPNDTATIGFYTDNGGTPNTTGNIPTGTLVGSLLTNPASSASAAAVFTFGVSGTITLNANTPYWLVIDASAGGFGWQYGSTLVPLSGDSTHDASPYRTSIDNGTTYSIGSHAASFEIDGTVVVPEPHEYAMVAGMGLLAFGFWRRRMAMA